MSSASSPPTGPTRLRETLIAAARELAAAHGWEYVRMVDVAKAAGVSRQTVYNEFGGRPALAEALAVNEVRSFARAIRRELFAHGGDPRAAGRATIALVLTEAAHNPLIKGILTRAGDGPDELLPYLTTRSDVVLATAGGVVREWIAAHHPGLGADVAATAAEAIVRLTVSHIVMPSSAPETAAEELAEVFVRLLR